MAVWPQAAVLARRPVRMRSTAVARGVRGAAREAEVGVHRAPAAAGDEGGTTYSHRLSLSLSLSCCCYLVCG